MATRSSDDLLYFDPLFPCNNEKYSTKNRQRWKTFLRKLKKTDREIINSENGNLVKKYRRHNFLNEVLILEKRDTVRKI